MSMMERGDEQSGLNELMDIMKRIDSLKSMRYTWRYGDEIDLEMLD